MGLEQSSRSLWVLYRLTLACLIVAVMWWPEYTHYDIDRSDVLTVDVQSAINTPPDDILKQIAQIDLMDLELMSLNATDIANEVANGVLTVPGLSSGPVRLVGYPRDFMVGPPTLALFMASLSVERLLLRAHTASGHTGKLEMALQRTVQMARYEHASHHNNSFLWNDHAIAGRVSLLIDLWGRIRHDPAMANAFGPELLSFLQRSGRLLAKPELFTVRTNHGVMQNIALLQLSAAFPQFSESEQWRRTAIDRLRLQLAFYVSNEGVILEHSSGYHALGVKLLKYAQLLITLNGLPADRVLEVAEGNSQAVLAALMRPDGSLPLIGDTGAGYYQHMIAQPIHASGAGIAKQPPLKTLTSTVTYAISGWSIWWTGKIGSTDAQLVTTWAKHDGHGHKHADEGSIHLWQGGVDWLTATGYWPYGSSLMSAAYSWSGSNAIHELAEPTSALRTATLGAIGSSSELRFIEIHRHTDNSADFHRQVVELTPNSWLVLDFTNNVAKGSETVWTLSPEVSVFVSVTNKLFMTKPLGDGRQMQIAISSSDTSLEARVLRGSRSPFGGWVVVRAVPSPADSIRVVQNEPQAVTASLFYIGVDRDEVAFLRAPKDNMTPESWAIGLRLDGRRVDLSRNALSLSVETRPLIDSAPLLTRRLSLARAGQYEASREALRSAYQRAVALFPPWRDLYEYRLRMTFILLALALTIEFIVAFSRRTTLGAKCGNTAKVTFSLTLLWIGLGIYLQFVYFGA